jgi:hypothetical protein
MPSPRKPVIVHSRPIDYANRVACALHHTLDDDGPLWLMIPIDEELAQEILEVILVSHSKERYITVPDKLL